MRSRRLAVLALSLSVIGVVMLVPGTASADEFTTTITCTAVSTCGTPVTTPTPPSGQNVTIEPLGGSTLGQGFRILPTVAGITITSKVATLSSGGTAQPVVESDNISFYALNDNFVSQLVVTWNNNATSTTTSTTTTSSTSSTSSTSTSSTTSTSTTTTTTIPGPGPGNGPQSIRPDAFASSSPDSASVKGTERTDVVVRHSDNNIYWSFEVLPNPFTAYQSLGAPPGGAKGNPALASASPRHLDVFVRGADDKLWQNFSSDGGATWFGWIRPFGEDGTLTASPELSTRGANRLNVYVVNTDGDVYEHFYDGPEVGGSGWNSNWIYHGKPAGGIAGSTSERSDPGSVAWGNSERLDLFVRGADNQLWQKFYNGAGWTDWFKPVDGKTLGGNTIASEPEAASWAQGNLLVFARGSDNRVYALPFGTGGWGDWVRLVRFSDTWQSGVGASSRGLERFDVFTRGTDNLTYHIWQ